MVQFLSIIFFSWISSIFVGFFKSSRFLVSLFTKLLSLESGKSLVGNDPDDDLLEVETCRSA